MNCTPGVTYLVDTKDFCRLSSVPEFIVLTANSIFSTVICLVGLAVFDKLEFFGFYEFPWAFRLLLCFQLMMQRKCVLHKCHTDLASQHVLPCTSIAS